MGHIPVTNGRKKYIILPCSEFEKRPSFFKDEADFIQMKKFIGDSRRLLRDQNLNFPEYVFNGDSWILDN